MTKSHNAIGWRSSFLLVRCNEKLQYRLINRWICGSGHYTGVTATGIRGCCGINESQISFPELFLAGVYRIKTVQVNVYESLNKVKKSIRTTLEKSGKRSFTEADA